MRQTLEEILKRFAQKGAVNILEKVKRPVGKEGEQFRGKELATKGGQRGFLGNE